MHNAKWNKPVWIGLIMNDPNLEHSGNIKL